MSQNAETKLQTEFNQWAEEGRGDEMERHHLPIFEPMLPLIPKFDALMMANHGAVCYGEDVFKAYFRMETLEQRRRVAWAS